MSKNQRLYFIFLFTVGLADSLKSTFLIDLLFYCTLLLIPFSYLSIFWTKRTLSIQQVANQSFIVKGDTCQLDVKLNNKSLLVSTPIQFVMEGSELLMMRRVETPFQVVTPFQHKSLQFPIITRFRGHYEVGIDHYIIYDYLKIFRRKYKSQKTMSITVHPQIHDLKKLFIHMSANEESDLIHGTKTQESDILVDVRQYAYGDPLKKIHWKLSAKNDELMVKRHHAPVQNSATLILDLKQMDFPDVLSKWTLEDKTIEVTVALLQYLLRFQVKTTLVMQQILKMERRSDFDLLYNQLAIVPFEGTEEIGKTLEKYFQFDDFIKYDNTENVYVVTMNPTLELFMTLTNENFKAFHFHVFYIKDQSTRRREQEEVAQMIQSEGIMVSVIHVSEDTENIAEVLDSTSQRKGGRSNGK